MLIKSTQGEVYQYGEFLKSKSIVGGVKGALGGLVSYKSDAFHRDICAGPYHCSTITLNHEMYSWGLDRMGSTGLPIKREQYEKRKNRMIRDPRQVVLLSREFDENKEKNKLLEENNNDEFLENKKVGMTTAPGMVTETEPKDEEEEKIPQEDAPLLKQEGKDQLAKTKKDKKKNSKEVMRYVTEDDINLFYKFIEKSNFRILSISKGKKFHGLHQYLVDEKVNRCDEMSIIRMNKRLLKYLDQILNIVRTCIEMQAFQIKNQFKIESAFISRVSMKPFSMERREMPDAKHASEYDKLGDIMTGLYIHPCYLNNIIKHELMSDDEIYDFLTEMYEYDTSIKVGYLASYTLMALKRDIIRGEDEFSRLDLRKLPSKFIIDMENKKNRAKAKAKRRGKKKGKKLDVKIEEKNDYLSDEEEHEENDRPESLFYRLWKFILKN